jgi:uncharacterized membrane protein
MFEDLTYFLRIHALVGSTALVSFWVAALARKGRSVHLAAGRIYLLSMCAVLLTTAPIILHFYYQGDVQRALTLVYLFFVTLSAMIFLFFSIRKKGSLAAYRNHLYKVYSLFMIVFGLFIFSLGLQNPLLVKKLLLFGFSSIGLVIGLSMAQLAWTRTVDQRWWLQQHLNGAMVAFAATHASFLGLGLRKMIPALSGDWMHTLTQISVIGLAYVLRIYLGRRMLGRISIRQSNSAQPSAIAVEQSV